MAALIETVLVQCPQWGFVPPLALAQLAGTLKAADCYRGYLALDPESADVCGRLEACENARIFAR